MSREAFGDPPEQQEVPECCPMRKATWLCFSRVDVRELALPYRPHDSRSGEGDRRRQQVMSKHQRAATVPALAAWLVGAARKAHNAKLTGQGGATCARETR